jgi:hypothetical protein
MGFSGEERSEEVEGERKEVKQGRRTFTRQRCYAL